MDTSQLQDIHKYFDWAATTPPDAEIWQKALEVSQEAWGNPSAIYSHGKNARDILENARATAAGALGCGSEQLFFTSGGTESNHIPILSILNRPQKENRGTVLISAIEHPSVRELAAPLKNCGYNVVFVLPDERGIVTADAVTNALTEDTVLVCVMAVNNETGARQPISEIAAALSKRANATGKRRAKLHVDCVQAIGKIPFDLAQEGIDSAAISAHKICGPRGIGALYLACGGKNFDAFTRGGGQEKNVRSGTENLFGAVALSLCLQKYAVTKTGDSLNRYEAQTKLTDKFIKEICAINGCTLVPAARSTEKTLYSPWIVQAAFQNIPGQVLVRALDAEGFAISTGSACSAKKQSRPVLEAMRVPPSVRENAVRFSFGPQTTQSDLCALVEATRKIADKFR